MLSMEGRKDGAGKAGEMARGRQGSAHFGSKLGFVAWRQAPSWKRRRVKAHLPSGQFYLECHSFVRGRTHASRLTPPSTLLFSVQTRGGWRGWGRPSRAEGTGAPRVS